MLEAIKNRRSIRKYKNAPVSSKTLFSLIIITHFPFQKLSYHKKTDIFLLYFCTEYGKYQFSIIQIYNVFERNS